MGSNNSNYSMGNVSIQSNENLRKVKVKRLFKNGINEKLLMDKKFMVYKDGVLRCNVNGHCLNGSVLGKRESLNENSQPPLKRRKSRWGIAVKTKD